jgi:hypothetical protein
MKREQVAVYDVKWVASSNQDNVTSTNIPEKRWRGGVANFSHFFIRYTITQSDRMWFRYWLRRGD